jgi:hypothetical protein
VAAALAAALAAAPAAPPASAQSVLLEDGTFSSWSTVPGLIGHEVSGQVDAAAGSPAPSYRIEHVHTPGGTFGGAVISRSVHTGTTYDLSGFAPADRLDFRVDACVGVLQGPPPPPMVELALQPHLVQGELFFRADQVATVAQANPCATGSPAFTRRTLEVPLGAFRGPGGATPNLAPGAPRVRLGWIVQTTWGLQGTVVARLDNLSVRHVPATAPPVSLELDDLGQAWADQVGETIGYRVTVANGGPPQAGLVVEVSVPNDTCFAPEGSSVGWECGEGMSSACGVDGAGLCTYPLGALASAESRELSFTVSLEAGVPPEWEFLAEARLRSGSGAELAVEDEVTPPISLAGPGCFCLFLPDLCSE